MERHSSSLLSVDSRRQWSLEDVDTELATGEVPEELRVTTVHDVPYMMIDPQPDGSYSCSGYLYDLWGIIAKELNVRFRMVPLLSGDYGTLHENGTWSGMVGELAYGRADVVLSSLVMRSDRAEVVDYLDVYPTQSVTYKFYIRRQREEIPQLTLDLFTPLFTPVHATVWWSLLAAVLILSVILWASTGLSRAQMKNRKPSRDVTWTSCLLSCFMTIVGQSWASTPSSLSARIVTLSCWTLGIIITTSYTADIISHLAIISKHPPITDLKEFSETPGWKLAVTPTHVSINDWKVSSNPYERELYRRTVTGQGFVPLDISSTESTYRSTHGKVMVYSSFDSLARPLGNDACLLLPVPNAPEKSYPAFMAISKKRKRLRRNINRLLLKMVNSGLIKRLKDRWVTPQNSTCETSNEYKAMAFTDILSVLLIMPLTMCACAVIFSLEWLLFKYGAIRKYLVAVYASYRERTN